MVGSEALLTSVYRINTSFCLVLCQIWLLAPILFSRSSQLHSLIFSSSNDSPLQIPPWLVLTRTSHSHLPLYHFCFATSFSFLLSSSLSLFCIFTCGPDLLSRLAGLPLHCSFNVGVLTIVNLTILECNMAPCQAVHCLSLSHQSHNQSWEVRGSPRFFLQLQAFFVILWHPVVLPIFLHTFNFCLSVLLIPVTKTWECLI